MKSNTLALVLFFSSASSVAAIAHAKTVEEILQKSASPADQGRGVAEELARRNSGYHDFSADAEMILADASGTESRRAFQVKILEGGSGDGDRSLIVFESPADIKGTSVLSHGHGDREDEQWLFLPSSRRTKRISSSNRSGSFVGSEFSFEDLTATDPRKYDWTLNGTEKCGAADCLVLFATPKDAASAYSRRVVRVEKDELRIASVEFIDRRGAKLKTLTYADQQKLDGGFWRARSWTMKNHQSGKSTVLRFAAMRMGNHFASSDFFAEKLGN